MHYYMGSLRLGQEPLLWCEHGLNGSIACRSDDTLSVAQVTLGVNQPLLNRRPQRGHNITSL